MDNIYEYVFERGRRNFMQYNNNNNRTGTVNNCYSITEDIFQVDRSTCKLITYIIYFLILQYLLLVIVNLS